VENSPFLEKLRRKGFEVGPEGGIFVDFIVLFDYL
jgi:hypothetical protein